MCNPTHLNKLNTWFHMTLAVEGGPGPLPLGRVTFQCADPDSWEWVDHAVMLTQGCSDYDDWVKKVDVETHQVYFMSKRFKKPVPLHFTDHPSWWNGVNGWEAEFKQRFPPWKDCAGNLPTWQVPQVIELSRELTADAPVQRFSVGVGASGDTGEFFRKPQPFNADYYENLAGFGLFFMELELKETEWEAEEFLAVDGWPRRGKNGMWRTCRPHTSACADPSSVSFGDGLSTVAEGRIYGSNHYIDQGVQEVFEESDYREWAVRFHDFVDPADSRASSERLVALAKKQAEQRAAEEEERAYPSYINCDAFGA